MPPIVSFGFQIIWLAVPNHAARYTDWAADFCEAALTEDGFPAASFFSGSAARRGWLAQVTPNTTKRQAVRDTAFFLPQSRSRLHEDANYLQHTIWQ